MKVLLRLNISILSILSRFYADKKIFGIFKEISSIILKKVISDPSVIFIRDNGGSANSDVKIHLAFLDHYRTEKCSINQTLETMRRNSQQSVQTNSELIFNS